jgi:gluconate 2-dehydrogenase gamma chain
MTIKSEWEIVGGPVDPDSEERLFFTVHEWDTVEAATARIIPTDHDPGAREARAIVFIDRYLSGIDYVFAAADGSGFLKLSGKFADAWRSRQWDMQRTYREGIRDLDALCDQHFDKPFVELSESEQDHALELFSGKPKPAGVTLGTVEAATTRLQGTFDQGLPFFEALCLHTVQGFYCDPVYGGNKDQVGWKTIGFPGPASLKDTMDGTYTTTPYFLDEYHWDDLIPHLATVNSPSDA